MVFATINMIIIICYSYIIPNLYIHWGQWDGNKFDLNLGPTQYIYLRGLGGTNNASAMNFEPNDNKVMYNKN